ncbi:WxL protein peptidoglycan domain-containing protein [Compostimonas suwonensis]|uniref:Uncharacterized protein DUF916 n=1 Tax=Compostimonas suwonensis TaxID=1048394 RepID=A0A2M9C4I4_9MICO|nr:DUF916 domain-containing protein [Compostimonas suwonensis]PJJ65438.1 uncharacterized protein DUF916 [Compostimonas suwonensis]
MVFTRSRRGGRPNPLSRVHAYAAAAGLAMLLVLPLAGVAAAEAVDDPAATSSPVTWGVRPADTIHGAGRPNYVFDLDPGETLDDAMVVSNYTEQPLTFRIYAADGFIAESGQLDLLPAGEQSTALGSWIDFESDEVTVTGGGTVTVPFTLAIPADATPGDYAAGVVSSMLVSTTEGVAVDRRLGSRMHVRVAGELAPRLEIADFSVSYDGGLNPFAPGAATVEYTMTNTGNTRIAAGSALVVDGVWGIGATPASGLGGRELLPGGSYTQTVTVDGIWPLLVANARLVVTGEVITEGGASTTEAPAVPDATASGTVAAVPWGALILLALLGALVVLVVLRVRRRRADAERKIAAAVDRALTEARATAATAAGADADVQSTTGASAAAADEALAERR